MRTVDVQIQRITKRSHLNKFDQIARQTAHLKKFERNGFYIKIFDERFFAFFEMTKMGLQILFRLNLDCKSND